MHSIMCGEIVIQTQVAECLLSTNLNILKTANEPTFMTHVRIAVVDVTLVIVFTVLP
jgi:hypothetical protein